MAIERPDWDHPMPVKGGSDAPLPDSKVPVPAAESRDLLAEQPADGADVANHPPASTDPIAQLSQEVIDAAAYVATQALAGHPDPEGFIEMFDALEPSIQAKAFEVMAAYPHLRGKRLVDKVKGRLNPTEAYLLNDWLQLLEPMDKVLVE